MVMSYKSRTHKSKHIFFQGSLVNINDFKSPRRLCKLMLLGEVKDGAADVPWKKGRNVYRSMAVASSFFHMEKYQQDKVGLCLESMRYSSCFLSATQSPKSNKPNLKCAVMQCPLSSAKQSQRTP